MSFERALPAWLLQGAIGLDVGIGGRGFPAIGSSVHPQAFPHHAVAALLILKKWAAFMETDRSLEARAGIEPACTDLQSLFVTFRQIPMVPETSEKQAFPSLNERTNIPETPV